MEINSRNLLTIGILLRVGFFIYGLYQDSHLEVKYTDIDYYVFTDAAKFIANDRSPYARETYRYTPLLALLLLPTTLGGFYFQFGKVLFMLFDLLTGILILRILELTKTRERNRLVLASLWLLNPMVITISSRGSSESILSALVLASIYSLLKGNIFACGLALGLSIHLKIYPIIYLPTMIVFLSRDGKVVKGMKEMSQYFTKDAIYLVCVAGFTFSSLTVLMFHLYGMAFLRETYIYHFIRIDHRHNFSLYNTALYFVSSLEHQGLKGDLLSFEKWAFIPQLGFSAVLIPWYLTKKDVTSTFFIQTFVFVLFNKVITSQYFVWYLCLLPFYLRQYSSWKQWPEWAGLVIWSASQGLWLYFAYQLEFKGRSTFYPQLFGAASLFFAGNIYLTGLFVKRTKSLSEADQDKEKKLR
ncbi:Glycosyl phosphatidyl inositol-alpha 1,4 mannosyltransferase I [Komagataella phaffii CBS 7435]|uniref:GPI mannosyltransferase 1 n=2 Tax=Komagataella phaffii TaxID=460519 RepID=C4R4E5_KOMPG|nr:Glycosylphosphatidylinositol-alpha 1,4 mannosyltransferase I [Komagataella phaffii GS115]AOA64141.1 GQ67_03451T0 [Komagataella phaffii]CAH2449814.1 Glycosyl phosphatidyl inositol-alpha 1,4 mannosyltransferase I [Komagataella phaffii CBS 7435]AOA68597.1 GQ68_03421T0 [Komagataella phaffii GS115]CAY70431.1 Glycosylphosphatidylinositol-alpha 1,4 mannosyltransferase I [Komagataella phaffii GS115]SCV12257.1 Glycosyl phosphatidyl inositol-alpha 1,4 mannosyltransferase I [Komagataella phaffii CBS 7